MLFLRLSGKVWERCYAIAHGDLGNSVGARGFLAIFQGSAIQEDLKRFRRYQVDSRDHVLEIIELYRQHAEEGYEKNLEENIKSTIIDK